MVTPGLHAPSSERIRDVQLTSRVSCIFLERGRLSASRHNLVFTDELGEIAIPASMAVALLLEPGVSVTHQAVQMASDAGTLLIWVSEAGGRVYGAGMGWGSADGIIEQARVVSDPTARLVAARRLTAQMLMRSVPPVRSIEQLRGVEGAAVREIYAQAAQEAGIPWGGRKRDSGDAVNDALNQANAMLYGISEAAILAMGYSPALGLIHSGDRRSFVFDVADVVKFTTVVPLAMRIAKEGPHDIRNRVRRACRDMFRAHNTIAVIARVVDGAFRDVS